MTKVNYVEQVANPPEVLVETYNFTRTKGVGASGDLSVAGPNVVVLTPAPEGINSLSINTAYLYVSGGTGTAEAALITQVISGVGSCTVSFTTANTHTGTWTITSASGGLQEAWNDNPNGTLKIASGVSVHAKITPPNGTSSLIGLGRFVALINRAEDYPNGDLIYGSSTSQVAISNLKIVNGTTATNSSGAAIHLYNNTSHWQIINVYIYGGYIGLDLDGSLGVMVTDFLFLNSTTAQNGKAAIYIHGAVGSNLSFDVGSLWLKSGTKGILVDDVDGMVIDGFEISGGVNSIELNNTGLGGTRLANIRIMNCFLDAPATSALYVQGTSINVQMSNCWMNGESTAASYAVDLGYSVPSGAGMVASITGGWILGFQKEGIAIGTDQHVITISGMTMTGNNLSAAAQGANIRIASGNAYVGILGNLLYGYAGAANYGINLEGAEYKPITIIGNDLSSPPSGPIYFGSTNVQKLIMANNQGIDNATVPTIASNTTITVGLTQPVINLSGTTTVTTINGGSSVRTLYIQKTDAGPVTVGGGGNIPGSHTLAQYGSLTLRFDGTNWY